MLASQSQVATVVAPISSKCSSPVAPDKLNDIKKGMGWSFGAHRSMAAVYEAIAAFHAVGYHPTVRELAGAAGLRHRVRAHEALIVLGKHNYVRRIRVTPS